MEQNISNNLKQNLNLYKYKKSKACEMDIKCWESNEGQRRRDRSRK
jgi:hypothetical protein